MRDANLTHGRSAEPARPLAALQAAIAAAESELSTRLRRSPTVDEVASHLNVAEHQIIAGLEARWSAGRRASATG
ncbi:MAG TPA: sigma-70 domain-containing protein [Actinoplanes sp.]|jgi:DNA-directed RNA polymerase specialized sigma subunit